MEIKTDYKKIEDDLILLRKNFGFDYKKIINTEVIKDLLNYRTSTIEDMREKFVSFINSLKDDNKINLMMMSYALHPEYMNIDSITKRRNIYGPTVNRKIHTLIKWENNTIEELAGIIFKSSQDLPQINHDLVSLYGNIIQTFSGRLIIVNDNVLVSQKHIEEFIAQIEDTHTIHMTIRYVKSVIANEGCKLVKLVKHGDNPDDETTMVFVLDGPIKKGGIYRYSYTIEFVDDDLGQNNPFIGGIREIIRSPAMKYSIDTVFLGKIPKNVWCVTQSYFDYLDGNTSEMERVKLEVKNDIAKISFSYLRAGTQLGIVWD